MAALLGTLDVDAVLAKLHCDVLVHAVSTEAANIIANQLKIRDKHATTNKWDDGQVYEPTQSGIGMSVKQMRQVMGVEACWRWLLTRKDDVRRGTSTGIIARSELGLVELGARNTATEKTGIGGGVGGMRMAIDVGSGGGVGMEDSTWVLMVGELATQYRKYRVCATLLVAIHRLPKIAKSLFPPLSMVICFSHVDDLAKGQTQVPIILPRQLEAKQAVFIPGAPSIRVVEDPVRVPQVVVLEVRGNEK